MIDYSLYFAILCTICVAGCAVERSPRDHASPGGRHIVVVAHRGAHQSCPENTIFAVEQAIALGVDYVEIDMRQTNDGAFVSLHNETVDARTNGHGRARDLTLTELRALDAGGKFSAAYAGATIPTVDEVLARMTGRVGAYVDVKDAPPESVVTLLTRHGMLESSIIYAHPEELAEMLQLEPRVQPLPEYPGTPEAWNSLAATIRTQTVAVSPLRNLSAEAVAACHSRGAKVIADIMADDTPAGWQRALDFGVDGLQTDRPAELLPHLRARGLRREAIATPEVEVIAHRGDHTNAPENTLEAFEAAIEAGVDWVELDPAFTADSHLVVLHDRTVDRTTDGTGDVDSLTLDRVRALNIRNRDGSLCPRARIPTVSESLSLMKGRVGVYLDKSGRIPASALVDAIRAHGDLQSTVIYADPATLEELLRTEPQTIRMLPRPPQNLGDMPDVVTRMAPAVFGAALRDVTPEKVAACHAIGAKVFVNVLSKDEPSGWAQAIECGADALETDRPREALAYLRERGFHR
jgi:glycerophosphoryl diester phosphodiesterase